MIEQKVVKDVKSGIKDLMSEKKLELSQRQQVKECDESDEEF